MISLKTFKFFQQISSIKQSLKVLQLNNPTTKLQIKKQYLILAKKYHPDSSNTQSKISTTTSTTSTNKKNESKTIDKQLQQKFVNINKAYQYLRQYTQQQINTNKDRNNQTNSSSSSSTSTTSSSNSNSSQQQQRRKMTVQQMQRQQTYEYFNKKYYQEVMNSKTNLNGNGDYILDDNQIQKPRIPLYKSVPQLFVGFLLLAVMLGDWTYRVMKRKNLAQKIQAEDLKKSKQYQKIRETQKMTDTFKNMGYSSGNVGKKKKFVQYIE